MWLKLIFLIWQLWEWNYEEQMLHTDDFTEVALYIVNKEHWTVLISFLQAFFFFYIFFILLQSTFDIYATLTSDITIAYLIEQIMKFICEIFKNTHNTWEYKKMSKVKYLLRHLMNEMNSRIQFLQVPFLS